MILKTYARIFTNHAEAASALFQRLYSADPHLRFGFGDLELIGIGDVLIVAGTDEALAPVRDTHGPLIVDDLEAAQDVLLDCGAVITQPIVDVPTGRMLYARHADGSHVEYVQWRPDLVERFIRAPQRAGRLSSEP